MTIEERVARLERSNRRWRLLAVSALALLGTGGLLAMRPAEPDELTLRKVVIVDAQGRQRVVLSGSGLIFADSEEIPRIVMATLDNGASAIQHFDAAGRRRIATGTFPDGGASVLQMDTERRVRLESGTYPGGDARIAQFDASGLPRLTAVTGSDGAASVEHLDTSGMPRISVGTSEAGLAEIRLVDQSGEDRLVDRVEADGRVSRRLHRDPMHEESRTASSGRETAPRG
jgi:hypothetical protein